MRVQPVQLTCQWWWHASMYKLAGWPPVSRAYMDGPGRRIASRASARRHETRCTMVGAIGRGEATHPLMYPTLRLQSRLSEDACNPSTDNGGVSTVHAACPSSFWRKALAGGGSSRPCQPAVIQVAGCACGSRMTLRRRMVLCRSHSATRSRA